MSWVTWREHSPFLLLKPFLDVTFNRFGGGFELLRDGDTKNLIGVVDDGVM